MADSLFPMLLVLTLLDLGFVQATHVVTGMDMLPLWLLAAASPWLRRLQRHRLYRGLWNLGVVVVFALLVHHATTTGLLHMLEDGLLLAILCQVHLLNNIGEQQRPDLVFFNSFLIAFVTSFFAPDRSWSLLFVLHAFAFVPALQIHALARRGEALGRGLMLSLLRDGLARTGMVGLVTALVFVAWPRDFHREGWLGQALAWREQFETGLAEEIRVDDERPTHLGIEVVMIVAPSSGQPEDVPSHWRGTAFSSFDGVAWLPQDASDPGSRFATDPPWERRADGTWDRDLPPAPGLMRVRLLGDSGRRVLCPLEGRSIRLENGEGLLLDPKSYGVFAFLRLDDAPSTPLAYTVQLSAHAGNARPSARTRQHLTALPEQGAPAIARDLAARLRAQLPAAADDDTIARTSCEWLQAHRRYQLPGGPGFARNLGEFLLGSGAGHCEYFATALALLLRLQGVPCRLVGGYLAHEWDLQAKAVVVRARHAHAWVEALSRDGSWITLDATPAADVMVDADAQGTWWDTLLARLEQLWAEVTAFDGSKRAQWLAGLAALPAQHPFRTAMVLLAAFALLYLVRRRRQSLPAIVDLQRAVRAAGLSLLAGETPRELLTRAAAVEMPPARLVDLQTAARHHESLRYGSSSGRCSQ